MPQTPAGLLTRMRSVSPSSPRLVWHGADGRIELSGRVFDNWVAKTSNLLVDELDATDGTTVGFDLPVHWKAVAWAFACWQVGAVPVLPDAVDPAVDTAADPDAGNPAVDSIVDPAADGLGEADIVLSSRAGAEIAPPRLLVCVALGSLALRWDGPLPRRAVDYAAEVRSQADAFLGQADADAPLVRNSNGTLNGDDLRQIAKLPEDGSALDALPTILVEPGADLVRVLAIALAVWDRDGALVLVEEGVAVTERMLAGERVTARVGPA